MVAGPLIMAIAIGYDVPWRMAVGAIGVVGLAIALMFVIFGGMIGEGGAAKQRGPSPPWRELLTSRPVLLMFLFYVCASSANSGIVHFSVPALGQMYGIGIVGAAIALTVYQLSSPCAGSAGRG